ncbi:hypothetical protein H7J87_15450 [Mycolicibacterium wolinskyi]|uniref:Uncharacterized protein n=1 Tax=Mycolicibacterium wolinskyi TaxID=59750 RepID=A0A1X2F819_9MYCO|nr:MULTISPECIES: hypothetical protein [Mycolicibacterium]MCV7286723.1 hypothetical protein [Mycolicibacterium wolinskyi]MCV7293703.1 hypothetical protein [Mycolicibacterium goodii]ORX14582.1 hypothetical protein AWC31_25705 [Mycolicibacterium wolinskyi]
MSPNDIARKSSWLPTARSPHGLSRAQARTLAHREGEELIEGLVTGARIQAKGYATLVATQLVGALSREAAFQSGGDPKVMARTDLLVDQFTVAAASEIGRL